MELLGHRELDLEKTNHRESYCRKCENVAVGTLPPTLPPPPESIPYTQTQQKQHSSYTHTTQDLHKTVHNNVYRGVDWLSW